MNFLLSITLEFKGFLTLSFCNLAWEKELTNPTLRSNLPKRKQAPFGERRQPWSHFFCFISSYVQGGGGRGAFWNKRGPRQQPQHHIHPLRPSRLFVEGKVLAFLLFLFLLALLILQLLSWTVRLKIYIFYY